ncbi:hypothetical protein [Roseospira navarrensis]|uniref:VPLPA-CTERM sorting domain-containing protein n=1 Tax=Roseospira navarrensis TaxID=140058 RepID=A0A7X2D2J9_9PROT|nr:hypothetical protein [Roseospira navarrensis]MQX35858.1 hypothetical protein [Roseospira navarrensis]
MRHAKIGLTAVAAVCGLSAASTHAAVLTEIPPTGFTSSNTLFVTGDRPLDTIHPEITFSSTTAILPANDNQLPRTGISFISPAPGSGTQRVSVSFGDGIDVFEVGSFFGNDDDRNPFLQDMTFYLDLYDRGGTYLGRTSAEGQGNDRIDTFLGLSSDVAIGTAVFRGDSNYVDRTAFIALDDLTFGYETDSQTVVPVPPALPLMLGALASLGVLRAGQRRQAHP